MIGIDTSFLVAFEIADHDRHERARALARERRDEGFALCTRIPAEFLHVVTDPRRFEHPLTMDDAIARIDRWWHAREVRVIHTGEGVGTRFLSLIRGHRLGRKNLLKTLLAATYLEAGIHVIATTNSRDFARFPGLGTLPV
ncbi:MAG: type II toxin-antitoxin system VapC family toxin [Alkalispirochaeta sp.]